MGRSLVKAALANGDLVAGVGRTFEEVPAGMRRLKEQNSNFLWMFCDVRARETVKYVIDKTIEHWGRIDIVANCSGYGVIGACEEQEEYDIRNQFETNLMAVLHIIQLSLPHFRERQFGRYIIFSSTSGMSGTPGLGPYCASKYAVEGLIESMLYEVDAYNIKATLVEPGHLRRDDATESTTNVGSPSPDPFGAEDDLLTPLRSFGHFLIKPASEPYNTPTAPAAHAKRIIQWFGDKQPTSARKTAQVVWQLGHCSFPPLRLLLGSCAVDSMRHRLRCITEEIEEWKHLNFAADDRRHHIYYTSRSERKHAHDIVLPLQTQWDEHAPTGFITSSPPMNPAGAKTPEGSRPKAQHSKPDVVDLTEDTDDEVQVIEKQPKEQINTDELASSAETRPSKPPDAFGILGLDRKKMEAERLARLTKKRLLDESSLPAAKRKAPVNPNLGSSKSSQTEGVSSLAAQAPKPKGLQYPNGTVKKTHVRGFSRSGDDITIEEVFQKDDDLELAVLSSFQWNMDWLFAKFDIENIAKTRFLLIIGAKDELQRTALQEDTASIKNLRLLFPPMESQVRIMHSKLMLLFHKEYLRIVVPSANLVPYDWGETGSMENIVFLIDLPKRTAEKAQETTFQQDLICFLRAQTFPEQLIDKLCLFDFAATSHLGFVHTIGGQHKENAWEKTGFCGLGRVVQSLQLQTNQPLELDYVTASVGSLKENFLRSMYLAAQGSDGLTALALRSKKYVSSKFGLEVKGDEGSEWKDHFR
ncbi:hypothetical protein KEM55_002030, partial [Ascosphaera atra]